MPTSPPAELKCPEYDRSLRLRQCAGDVLALLPVHRPPLTAAPPASTSNNIVPDVCARTTRATLTSMEAMLRRMDKAQLAAAQVSRKRKRDADLILCWQQIERALAQRPADHLSMAKQAVSAAVRLLTAEDGCPMFGRIHAIEKYRLELWALDDHILARLGKIFEQFDGPSGLINDYTCVRNALLPDEIDTLRSLLELRKPLTITGDVAQTYVTFRAEETLAQKKRQLLALILIPLQLILISVSHFNRRVGIGVGFFSLLATFASSRRQFPHYDAIWDFLICLLAMMPSTGTMIVPGSRLSRGPAKCTPRRIRQADLADDGKCRLDDVVTYIAQNAKTLTERSLCDVYASGMPLVKQAQKGDLQCFFASMLHWGQGPTEELARLFAESKRNFKAREFFFFVVFPCDEEWPEYEPNVQAHILYLLGLCHGLTSKQSVDVIKEYFETEGYILPGFLSPGNIQKVLVLEMCRLYPDNAHDIRRECRIENRM